MDYFVEESYHCIEFGVQLSMLSMTRVEGLDNWEIK
jgi:hypothetical protein